MQGIFIQNASRKIRVADPIDVGVGINNWRG